MVQQQVANLSFAQICRSGQCFRMREYRKGVFEVIAGSRRLVVSQDGEWCRFDCEQEEFDNFWRDYFDLDTDYSQYLERINPRDIYLVQAAEVGWGIRILHQDLWEMIVTFLISQQNNITRIRRCVENICEKYGQRCQDENGIVYYGFPEPQALAELDENALMECNLGYRSKYVVRTAKMIASGEFDLEAVKHMSYSKAKPCLMTLFGVGEKVADCICLFSLHPLQSFPVDTHIRQALDAHYKRGFPNRRYRGIQGVMQQYIFYYELGK